MGMDWIKLWTKMLSSTVSYEMDIGGFGFFTKLLLLAGRDSFDKGEIKYSDHSHLAQMINCKADDCERYIKKLKATNRISMRKIEREGYLIRIINWPKYQASHYKKKTKKKGRGNTGTIKNGGSRMTNRLDKIRLDKKRRDDSRKDKTRKEESEERREEKRNNTSQNPHPPTSNKVEALIKEKSKSFTERKTKKLDTSEKAFSQQMDEILTKKKKEVKQ